LAKPAKRRDLNQLLFEHVLVDDPGIVYARLADPFALLFADEPMPRLGLETTNRGAENARHGSNDDPLVGGMISKSADQR
jgi:hypothetical protein